MSLQSLTKADDISDFEIEGMSIGDSALDFFSESEIKSNKQNYYKKKDFIPVYIVKSFKIYEGIQFHYKKSDKSYKLHAVSGIIEYNNIDDCYDKMKEIDQEFKSLFKNSDRSDNGKRKHPEDTSGKSIQWGIYYFLPSDDVAVVSCFDWSKKMNYPDHLRISLVTGEFNSWAETAF